MKSLLILVGAVFSIHSYAEVKFQNGNNLDVQPLRGTVQYLCHNAAGQTYSRIWSCRDNIVSPGTHDYLVSTTPINANKIKLVAAHQNGETTTKELTYNPKNNISKRTVNLLITSVTQKPLLHKGHNEISYEFKDGKKTVTTGTFQAHVIVKDPRVCRDRSVISHDEKNCEYQNFGCDYYFWLENNCQN